MPGQISGMFSRKMAWIRTGTGSGLGSPRAAPQQPVDGLARLDPRVLVDHRIHGAREQEAAGMLGQLVADEHHLAAPGRPPRSARAMPRLPAPIL